MAHWVQVSDEFMPSAVEYVPPEQAWQFEALKAETFVESTPVL
jgi:hypothetical protein